ncbi:MAG: hypothetical protein GY869_27605, partial [Planctomycetes bacterium]|nr:hypothetical protein [Planctomycetota bacterium]
IVWLLIALAMINPTVNAQISTNDTRDDQFYLNQFTFDDSFYGIGYFSFMHQIMALQDAQIHNDNPDLRRQWYHYQRAYPNAEIPLGAERRARQYLNQVVELQALAPPVGGVYWQQIGPAPINVTNLSGPWSGRIRSIAVQSPSVIYIGAASGGVWKTTNAGASWTPLTDDQPSLAMGSVAIDSTNLSIIYAGTGEYDANGPALYGAGLLKSTDGGSNWTH